MPPGQLGALPLLDFLKENERALLQSSAAPSPESLHGLLAASPSLGRGPRRIRRKLLMGLLEQRLSPGYRALLAVPRAAREVPMLGASPKTAKSWTLTNPDLPAGLPATGPLDEIDLLGGLPKDDDGVPVDGWEVRKQAGRPTCVAEASTACIELMLALATPDAITILSPQFLDDRLRARRLTPSPGFDTIPFTVKLAKLGEAARILQEDGICLGSRWDDKVPPDDTLPDAAALTDAAGRKFRTAFYLDQPPGSLRRPGLARRLHAELLQHRPVAIALPGFRDKTLKAGDTSWQTDLVKFTGQLPDMGETHQIVEDSGHAVCLVGFRPDAGELAGGYFVFRNSWGRAFGDQARNPNPQTGPRRLPAPGYGTIPANYVENACWEALSFTPDPPP